MREMFAEPLMGETCFSHTYRIQPHRQTHRHTQRRETRELLMAGEFGGERIVFVALFFQLVSIVAVFHDKQGEDYN